MYRGEIWLINLDPTVGAEIKKTRPAVIINDDAVGILPLKVILPLTDWKDRYEIAPWMVKLIPNQHNGLIKNSAIDTFQIRSVSKTRFVQKMGTISQNKMQEVSKALKIVLAIP
ncbi:type II toxin-antitoxin system PemK/MazF family toxin [Desulfonema magnum]|uniref:mRNA interferase n=1 Tax=Desulfonema magnum TaxID=45655 RepID=A0A975GP41_9BACT|nr:type II toxin-antitoxin system PemK/MazF family toxin [Desulfonema magnum]QTA88395.1 Toxin-antitoxin system, toxin component, mRNA interferase PemK/MazF-like [Desulfonema magnum]